MNRFVENKYFRWYLAITASSDSGCYVERHHIIPKSFGGTNEKSNLVKLSFRKHFLAHWLLTKCTVGQDRMRMLYALNLMTKHTTNNRIVSSWQYALGKRAQSDAMRGKPSPWKGKTPTDEMRKRMSDARKGKPSTFKGKRHTEGALRKQRAAKTGKIMSEQFCQKNRQRMIGNTICLGRELTADHKAKVSASLMGNTRKLNYKDPSDTLERKRASQLQRKTYNRTGWRWVSHWPSSPSKPWRARINRRGQSSIELGLFDCPAAAHFAALIAADIYYSSRT